MLTAEQKADIRRRVQAPYRTAARPKPFVGRTIPTDEQRLQELIEREARILQAEREAAERRRREWLESQPTGEQLREEANQRTRERLSKPVVALHPDGTPDESRTWPNSIEAARELGVCPSAIREAIKGGWACHGVYLARAGHPAGALKPIKGRAVIRLSDGKRFTSMAQILDHLHDQQKYRAEHAILRRLIRHGQPYKGEFYVYADQYNPAQAAPENPCGRIGPERPTVLADGQRRAV